MLLLYIVFYLLIEITVLTSFDFSSLIIYINFYKLNINTINMYVKCKYNNSESQLYSGYSVSLSNQ